MDLGAYTNIENLDNIAKENGIEVPRLRGYRLMKYEEAISKEEIEEMKKECEVGVARKLCCATPFWSPKPEWRSYNSWTDYVCEYYLVKDKDRKKYVDIRWDRIHGWKRRVLKFEVKKQKRRIQKQWDLWNKYAGKENVLYIHSRIGGNNWNYYGGNELIKQSWFLDKADDYFDRTYCDIYAKIK